MRQRDFHKRTEYLYILDFLYAFPSLYWNLFLYQIFPHNYHQQVRNVYDCYLGMFHDCWYLWAYHTFLFDLLLVNSIDLLHYSKRRSLYKLCCCPFLNLSWFYSFKRFSNWFSNPIVDSLSYHPGISRLNYLLQRI